MLSYPKRQKRQAQSKSFAVSMAMRTSHQRHGVPLSLLPLFHPRGAMISRAQGQVIAPKAPEKTGAVQKLRRFDGYANLAPASWSAAVPSAAFSSAWRYYFSRTGTGHRTQSARKDRRSPKASPFRWLCEPRASVSTMMAPCNHDDTVFLFFGEDSVWPTCRTSVRVRPAFSRISAVCAILWI